jgi:hypothetical protein
MSALSANDAPVLEVRLDEHERRISTLERDGRQDTKELWQALGRLEKTVEATKGWMSASVFAASLLGSVVAFIAMKVFK